MLPRLVSCEWFWPWHMDVTTLAQEQNTGSISRDIGWDAQPSPESRLRSVKLVLCLVCGSVPSIPVLEVASPPHLSTSFSRSSSGSLSSAPHCTPGLPPI